ncbi:hypothetical protein INT43_005997 [Umbelopsis isabellina]|uniref:SAM-dependent MTase RsmB/NOP-type domain-containing protein n=1 Tax=Mortierella isabellina TaxID=91625 RepID=A0A8H7U9R6_MORIS|nr:hypothetical protein INT43_005997 [Umbelopsis isabellina]
MSPLPPLEVPSEVAAFFLNVYTETHWETLRQQLACPPTTTYFRVIVPLSYRPDLDFTSAVRERRNEILPELQSKIDKHCISRNWDTGQYKVLCHSMLDDVLYLPVLENFNIEKPEKEVMIDTSAGTAVLRGADIFAPGILAAESDTHVDNTVAIMVDMDKKCLRGRSKRFDGRKIHVGNGILKQSRQAIFSKKPSELSGDGVIMTDPIYKTCGIPQGMNDQLFLQNITSTLASALLEVGMDHKVLDMCASPGGKSIHIASMCRGFGCVIALDKNKYKIDRILKNAQIYQVEKKVRAYICDSTNLEGDSKPDEFKGLPGQGLASESFDRIMLDPPCTGLGQRPVFGTTSEVQKVNSFRTAQPAYQKRLMTQAVRLLKVGGIMVYSTCTLNPHENEEVIADCLSRYPNMQLIDPEVKIGGPGLLNYGLNAEDCERVQRFDPTTHPETVGFFIAKLCRTS